MQVGDELWVLRDGTGEAFRVRLIERSFRLSSGNPILIFELIGIEPVVTDEARNVQSGDLLLVNARYEGVNLDEADVKPVPVNLVAAPRGTAFQSDPAFGMLYATRKIDPVITAA